MPSRLLLLITLLPLVEIAVLAWIATQTSVLFVLALVIGMGALGAALARYQGWQTMRRISADLETNHMPGDALLDGLLVLLAALLLIIPGVVSEIDGSVTYAASDDAEVYSVVDEIARRALYTGARVLGARREELPDRAPLVAILRYQFG